MRQNTSRLHASRDLASFVGWPISTDPPRGKERTLFRLDGRTAVITGAASGIGAATALLLADAGADIVVGWHPGDPHDPEAVAAAIRTHGRRVSVVACDVTSSADVDELIGAAVALSGRVDIAVANAGITRTKAAADLDDASFNETLDVDLLGAFRVLRAALPHMRAQRWGRLLVTSSVAGAVQGWPDHAHYAAAKAGVVGMVRSLALEVGRTGITVNCVAPGVVVSPQTEDPVNSLGPEGLRRFADTVPVGRNGRPEDVGAAFLYLASEEAGFVTGHTLVVDGGTTLSLV